MSASKIGNTYWLGKFHSQETKDKISAANSNPSQETKAKQSAAQSGRSLSLETKIKMSLAKSGEKSYSAKLTWKEVGEIRDIYKIGDCTQQQLSTVLMFLPR